MAAFLAAADTETAGKSRSAPLQSRGTGSPTSTDTDPSPSRQIELSLQSINEKPFEVLDSAVGGCIVDLLVVLEVKALQLQDKT